MATDCLLVEAEVCTQVKINGTETQGGSTCTNMSATAGRSTIRLNSSHNNGQKTKAAQYYSVEISLGGLHTIYPVVTLAYDGMRQNLAFFI